MYKKPGGFTLIELLVVFALISLFSAVVFAVLSESRAKGRDASRISTARSLKTALALWEDKNGSILGINGGGYGNMFALSATTSKSIIDTLVEDGMLSRRIASDAMFGSSTYYLGVCPDGRYDVFTKMERSENAQASSTTNIACDGGGALAVGYNYAYGLGSGGGTGAIGGGGGGGGGGYTYGPFVAAVGNSDIDWSPSNGALGTVYTMAYAGNGKAYIGGTFTTYNGAAASRIARIDVTTGALDPTFNTGAGFDADVRAIAVQSDGKIIVVGGFTQYNGSARSFMARLNPDGSADSMSTNPGGPGFAVAVLSDDSFVIGRPGGGAIIKYSATGTLDTTFNTNRGTGATEGNGIVQALLVDASNRIYVGGDWVNWNGASNGYLVRLNSNGTLDGTFTGNGTPNSAVYGMNFQSAGGPLLIAGEFTAVGSCNFIRVGRIQTSGACDSAFGSGVSHGVDATARTIARHSGLNGIISGGSFNNYVHNAVPTSSQYINMMSTTDGTLMAYPGTSGMGLNNAIYTTLSLPDGSMLVGGSFTGTATNSGAAGPIIRRGIIKINTSGGWSTTFNQRTGADGNVLALAKTSDGGTIVGGYFRLFNNISQNYLTKLKYDGTLDTNFNGGTGANSHVSALAVQSDGKILVGGNFSTFSGGRAYYTRLNQDGTTDNLFNSIGTGPNGPVSAITMQPDGKTLIGGSFSAYNGVTRYYLTRVNADGTNDDSFGNNAALNANVNSIAVQSNGKIIIGGSFTSSCGNTNNIRLVRLNADGTCDGTFTPPSVNNVVRSVVVGSGDKIYIGGSFTAITVGSTPANSIVRLNPNGTVDSTFQPSGGMTSGALIYAMALTGDGKLYATGQFTSYAGFGGSAATRLVRINTTDGSHDSSFQAGFPAEGRAILALPDGSVITGGYFNYATQSGGIQNYYGFVQKIK